jgi:uncharacterized protein (DUF2252 family)
MLIGDQRMVILDCEVAWYGDPAFDLAFLLSHLLLKSAYHAPRDIGLPRLIDGFLAGYKTARRQSTEQTTALDYHTAHLVQHLLLARIDGKSPVEYLDEPRRCHVRDFALAVLRESRQVTVPELTGTWFQSLAATTFKAL